MPVTVKETATVVLISDILSQLSERRLHEQALCTLGTSLEEWWRREVDQNVFAAHDADQPWKRTYPLVFHEDAVPNYHEETATVYSWTCPLNGKGSWVSRNAFLVVPSSRITLETRKTIVRVIAWDLESLRRGTWPQADHEGVPFGPNTPQARRAGTPIMREDYRAVFAWWKGDMESHKLAHALQRHYNKACICDLCFAMSNNDALNYGDFHERAYWRSTEEPRDPTLDVRSPWCQVRGFYKHRRLFDSALSLFMNHLTSLSFQIHPDIVHIVVDLFFNPSPFSTESCIWRTWGQSATLSVLCSWTCCRKALGLCNMHFSLPI